MDGTPRVPVVSVFEKMDACTWGGQKMDACPREVVSYTRTYGICV